MDLVLLPVCFVRMDYVHRCPATILLLSALLRVHRDTEQVERVDARRLVSALVVLDEDNETPHVLELDVLELDTLALGLLGLELEDLRRLGGRDVVEVHVVAVREQLYRLGRLLGADGGEEADVLDLDRLVEAHADQELRVRVRLEVRAALGSGVGADDARERVPGPLAETAQARAADLGQERALNGALVDVSRLGRLDRSSEPLHVLLQRLGVRTADLLDDTTALDELERRHRADLVPPREVLLPVHVHLAELYLRVLVRELLVHGGDRMAWSTPRSVEVEDEELVRGQRLLDLFEL